MKDKITEFGSCVSLFAPNLQTSFATMSPFGLISGPTSTKVYYWAGSVFPTENANTIFGTLGRIREEDRVYKHDQWTIRSTVTPSVIRFLEVSKVDVVNPSHHFEQLPANFRQVGTNLG